VSEPNPILEQVRSGENEGLVVLAAQGILPLPPEDLVPLQVELASSEDPMLAAYARKSLEGIDPAVARTLLAGDAPPHVTRWFALEHRDPQLVEVILQRRGVAPELLVELAPQLSPDLQETLLLRQDSIVERPEILDALERNPQLSTYAARRAAEYRQHLLARDLNLAEASAPAAVELEDAGLTAEERLEVEQALQLPASGEVDERTGLSEAQVRSLPVPVRIKLARGASRTLRSILIKDSNRLVCISVLSNAAFTEDEIEQVAANRSIDEEVLATISRRREWVSRYGTCRALVQNPRTPVGISVRLVARLSVRDLKLLSKDRNVPEPVRSAAGRLYRIKSV
jgi:hypothetical protein